MKIDCVIGGAWGDEAKSKTALHLLKKGSYSAVIKSSGGSNKGGTFYIDGKKFAVHSFPVGIAHNTISVIGSGCVLNVKKLFKEIEEFEKAGLPASKLVKIANNVHIVTEEHILEDTNETRIGSTGQGISFVQRDKALKLNKRAEDIPELKNMIIDMYDEFYIKKHHNEILMEGSQGYNLDIDHGNYPYVTSSSCGVAAVLISGLPYNAIRNVYMVIKSYDSYIGSKKFQPNDKFFETLADVGQEFGVVTGRKRQVNYLNLNNIVRSALMNGATHIVVNKMDILRTLNHWRMLIDNKIESFTEETFKQKLIDTFLQCEVIFSYSPYSI